jgi:hypothetical protein
MTDDALGDEALRDAENRGHTPQSQRRALANHVRAITLEECRLECERIAKEYSRESQLASLANDRDAHRFHHNAYCGAHDCVRAIAALSPTRAEEGE